MPRPATAPTTRAGQIERRTFPAGALRVRQEGDGAPRLAGYAAVFNTLSEMWGYWERIQAGAFARSIREGADVRCLWNHNAELVLGRTTNGSLRLAEDNVGLHIECEPPATNLGKDSVETVRRGDVNQMSFGFWTPDGGVRWDTEGDKLIRTLVDLDLGEVSPCTFPQYPETQVEARSMRRTFAAAGLDFDGIGRILVMAERGIAVQQPDLDTLTATVDKLRELVTKATFPAAEALAPLYAIEYRTRRLRLLEIEEGLTS
jgi:hypothetical protein